MSDWSWSYYVLVAIIIILTCVCRYTRQQQRRQQLAGQERMIQQNAADQSLPASAIVVAPNVSRTCPRGHGLTQLAAVQPIQDDEGAQPEGEGEVNVDSDDIKNNDNVAINIPQQQQASGKSYVCMMCSAEMPLESLGEHMAKYHSQLLAAKDAQKPPSQPAYIAAPSYSSHVQSSFHERELERQREREMREQERQRQREMDDMRRNQQRQERDMREMERKMKEQERKQRERERKMKEENERMKRERIRKIRGMLPRVPSVQFMCNRCGQTWSGPGSSGPKSKACNEHKKHCRKTWNCGICGRSYDNISFYVSHVRSCTNLR
mmetsp:Transcript_62402/g.56266  ORF Transcript_62402/g.56266 Transcript_62402/m.56266 type:complete len:322 (-) Transcript_62402:55-1020(-)